MHVRRSIAATEDITPNVCITATTGIMAATGIMVITVVIEFTGTTVSIIRRS